MIDDVTPRNSDLVRRAGETVTRGNRTMRRRIVWRLNTPSFDTARDSKPYDVTGHAEGLTKGGRVFIVGRPQTKSQIQASSQRYAAKVYAEGRYPTVTAANGVQIGYAANWFGEGPYTARDCVDVWCWLEDELRNAWRDDGIRLLMTPATTGRDLWARSIDAEGWPIMSTGAQTLVRSTAGQGRMEIVRPGGGPALSTLFEYDARMAYVSLLDGLPIGEPHHHAGPSAEMFVSENPYNEGRFKVRWDAPSCWSHPGILPAHGSGDVDWIWPLHGDGWCSGVELFTARRAGWRVTIAEGYVWPVKANPLRCWRDRLLRALVKSEGLPVAQRSMARAAIRGMILHTIGALHGSPYKVSETGPNPPADAQGIRQMGADLYSWWRMEAARWPQMVHPEWSATIWGRARARLVSGHRGRTGFLTVDPSILVAFRTDAIYTTQATGWEQHDDGATPGRYRVRPFTFEQARPWPTNGPDLLRLRGQS